MCMHRRWKSQSVHVRALLELFQPIITVVKSRHVAPDGSLWGGILLVACHFPEIWAAELPFIWSARFDWNKRECVRLIWDVSITPLVKSCQKWRVVSLSHCCSSQGTQTHRDSRLFFFLRLCLCVHENWLVTQACLALLNPEKWVDVSQGYKYKQCICAELKQLTDSNWKATEGRK